MDLIKLADALIPDENVKELSYYEERYPERNLEKGADRRASKVRRCLKQTVVKL